MQEIQLWWTSKQKNGKCSHRLAPPRFQVSEEWAQRPTPLTTVITPSYAGVFLSDFLQHFVCITLNKESPAPLFCSMFLQDCSVMTTLIQLLSQLSRIVLELENIPPLHSRHPLVPTSPHYWGNKRRATPPILAWLKEWSCIYLLLFSLLLLLFPQIRQITWPGCIPQLSYLQSAATTGLYQGLLW